MTQYAKKTCNSCGIRLPQPEMHRVEKEVQSGSSNTGLTKRALFGAAIGNKKSTSSVGNFLFSPSKRNYKRRREVWMCADCAGVGGSFWKSLIELIGTLIGIFIVVVVLSFLSNFIN